MYIYIYIYINIPASCRQGALPHCQLSHLRRWTGWADTLPMVQSVGISFFFFSPTLLCIMDTVALAPLVGTVFRAAVFWCVAMLTLGMFASWTFFSPLPLFSFLLMCHNEKLVRAWNHYLLEEEKKAAEVFPLTQALPKSLGSLYHTQCRPPCVDFGHSVIARDVNTSFSFCIVLAFYTVYVLVLS